MARTGQRKVVAAMQANVIQVMILTATLAAGLSAFLLLAVLLRRQRPATRTPEVFGGSYVPAVAAPVLLPVPAPVAVAVAEPVVVDVAPAPAPVPEPCAGPPVPAVTVRRGRGNNRFSAPRVPAANSRSQSSV